jgi:hypothetical protein
MQKRKEKSKEEELVLENFLSAYLIFKNSFLFLKDFHDDLFNIVPCLVRVLKCYFKKREICWLADQVIKDIGLSTCLSVKLSLCLSVFLYACLSYCLSVSLSVFFILNLIYGHRLNEGFIEEFVKPLYDEQ